jgi:hypothetical protein
MKPLIEPLRSPSGKSIGEARLALTSVRGEWRRLARQLADLRTATPVSPSIRADLRGVQQLLRQLVPLPPADGASIDRPTATVLLGAVRSLPDIAGWNAYTFSDLVASRQVYAAGRCLTGDEVTDHDELVGAKLGDSLARIPIQRLVAVRDSYAMLQRPSPSVGHGPGMDRTIGRGLAVDPPQRKLGH